MKTALLIPALIMPSVNVLMAFFFVFLALRVLLTRRPIIFSTQWIFALMCVVFVPQLATMADLSLSSKHFEPATLLPLGIVAVILAFFWNLMRGYIVFAISETYLRDALLAVIASLGYTAEETMSRLKIKETGDEIQVAVQGWMGSAQIKPANKASAGLVRRIAAGMNEHFKTTPGQAKYLIAWFYLTIGVLLIGCGAFLAVVTHAHHPLK